MLVLPRRDLNDLFRAEALAVPEIRHIFRITTDLDPEEVDDLRIHYRRNSLFSTTEVTAVNNGREKYFILPAFCKIYEKLNMREGSYYA